MIITKTISFHRSKPTQERRDKKSIKNMQLLWAPFCHHQQQQKEKSSDTEAAAAAELNLSFDGFQEPY